MKRIIVKIFSFLKSNQSVSAARGTVLTIRVASKNQQEHETQLDEESDDVKEQLNNCIGQLLCNNGSDNKKESDRDENQENRPSNNLDQRYLNTSNEIKKKFNIYLSRDLLSNSSKQYKGSNFIKDNETQLDEDADAVRDNCTKQLLNNNRRDNKNESEVATNRNKNVSDETHENSPPNNRDRRYDISILNEIIKYNIYLSHNPLSNSSKKYEGSNFIKDNETQPDEHSDNVKDNCTRQLLNNNRRDNKNENEVDINRNKNDRDETHENSPPNNRDRISTFNEIKKKYNIYLSRDNKREQNSQVDEMKTQQLKSLRSERGGGNENEVCRNRNENGSNDKFNEK